MTRTKKTNRPRADLTTIDGRIVAMIEVKADSNEGVSTGTIVEIDLGDELVIVRLGQYLGSEKRYGRDVNLFDYER